MKKPSKTAKTQQATTQPKGRKNKFKQVLERMLANKEIRHIVSSVKRDDIVILSIKDVQKFKSEVLPKYFKHANWESFLRQLNMYQFYRPNRAPPKHLDFNSLKPRTSENAVTYYHEYQIPKKTESQQQIGELTRKLEKRNRHHSNKTRTRSNRSYGRDQAQEELTGKTRRGLASSGDPAHQSLLVEGQNKILIGKRQLYDLISFNRVLLEDNSRLWNIVCRRIETYSANIEAKTDSSLEAVLKVAETLKQRVRRPIQIQDRTQQAFQKCFNDIVEEFRRIQHIVDTQAVIPYTQMDRVNPLQMSQDEGINDQGYFSHFAPSNCL